MGSPGSFLLNLHSISLDLHLPPFPAQRLLVISYSPAWSWVSKLESIVCMRVWGDHPRAPTGSFPELGKL